MKYEVSIETTTVKTYTVDAHSDDAARTGVWALVRTPDCYDTPEYAQKIIDITVLSESAA